MTAVQRLLTGRSAQFVDPAAYPLQNVILTSKVVSGNADYFSLPGGLTLRLLASVADPFVASVNGVIVTLTSNVDLTLTNTAHNFIFLKSDGTIFRDGLPTTFSPTAPGGPVSGQHWFDLGHNLMMVWDGAAWVAEASIPIGYARADGGAIDARYACDPFQMTPTDRYEKFGDGSDGFGDFSAGTTQLTDIWQKQYTALVVRGSEILTSEQGNPLKLLAQNYIAVLSTASISSVGKGATGAAGVANSNGAQQPFDGYIGGSGGGGGGSHFSNGGGGQHTAHQITQGVNRFNGGNGGSNNGGNGSAGQDAVDTATAFWFGDDPIYMFGGAGGSGGSDSATSGAGGGGGGFLFLKAPSIAIAAGASVTSAGANGGAAVATTGAGGGGGGGSLWILCRNYFNTGTVTAAGGVGGLHSGANSGDGAAGGNGVATRRVA